MLLPRRACLVLHACIVWAQSTPVPSSEQAPSPQDVGYESLFVTHNESSSQCINASGIPPSLVGGSFLIPSLGQFEMGSMHVQGLFDAFGKLHRFSFEDGVLCFKAQMMDTEYYNQSRKQQSIAASNLFYNTVPARKYNGMQNILGPNDNVFVNTYRINNTYRAITDAQAGIEFDPVSLHMKGKFQWTDDLDKPGPPIRFMSGSAHPLPHGDCMVNVHPDEGMWLGWYPKVSVYSICPSAPTERVKLASYNPAKKMPYFHSWGLTSNYAVLPEMPFTLSVLHMVEGGTIVDAFQDVPETEGTVVLLPLDGSAATKFTVPNRTFYYSHTINSYETPDGVISDVIMFDQNPFTQASFAEFYRNESMRNNMPKALRGQVTRMTLHTTGSKNGTVTLTPLSDEEKATDFPTINDEYHQKPYCIYYATEWFHQDTYASMAIVKHNMCSNTRVYWYQPNAYPSEPRFEDDPESHVEDDGSLLFTLTDGVNNKSSLVVLNASSMQEVVNFPVPSHIGFTTHGQFYSNLDLNVH